LVQAVVALLLLVKEEPLVQTQFSALSHQQAVVAVVEMSA
jgi:hypothetical protein